MSVPVPPFQPPVRLLMGPGPSNTHPRVLKAMTAQTVGHMDPWFLATLGDLAGLLRYAFRTQNTLTLAAPGTGSAGMEAMFNNLVEPGDAVLVGSCGYFGDRMVEMARRHGADLTVLRVPYGRAIAPEQVAELLAKKQYKLVALVHAETSTGVLQPLADIAPMVKKHGALLVIDAVTSLGGVPVDLDAWGVDGVYSCSQKCLACPPGLSPVSFSSAATDRMAKRKSPPPGWYLDMNIIRQYWGTDRLYHHTAPINMTYALFEGLRMLAEETLEVRFERHRTNGAALKAGLSALGLEPLTQAGVTMPQLHCVGIPAGLDDVKTRKRLMDEHGIEVGGGLGEFKGKAWRIGLMGEVCKPENVLRLLELLEKLLGESGIKVGIRAGVSAAEASYKAVPPAGK